MEQKIIISNNLKKSLDFVNNKYKNSATISIYDLNKKKVKKIIKKEITTVNIIDFNIDYFIKSFSFYIPLLKTNENIELFENNNNKINIFIHIDNLINIPIEIINIFEILSLEDINDNNNLKLYIQEINNIITQNEKIEMKKKNIITSPILNITSFDNFIYKLAYKLKLLSIDFTIFKEILFALEFKHDFTLNKISKNIEIINEIIINKKEITDYDTIIKELNKIIYFD